MAQTDTVMFRALADLLKAGRTDALCGPVEKRKNTAVSMEEAEKNRLPERDEGFLLGLAVSRALVNPKTGARIASRPKPIYEPGPVQRNIPQRAHARP